jgi:capsular exopolysaccharide synthesis family protein
MSSTNFQEPQKLNLPGNRASGAHAENDDEGGLDWRPIAIAIREKLWLVILLPLLGLGISWGYLQQAKPVFSSSSTLEVEDKKTVVKVEEVTDVDLGNSNAINTLAATIRSTTFLARLVNREKLNLRPELFGGSIPSGDTVQAAVGILAGSLSALPRAGTRLLDITARHGNATMARDIAIAAANGVMKWDLEQRAESVGMANDFLQQESERLRKKLQDSELGLQKYRVENNAVSLEENQNLVVAQLQDLSNKLSQQTTERVRLETEYAALMQMKSHPDQVINLQIVSSHPTLGGISKALAEKKSEFSAMQSRYKSKHPRYIAIQADIANLESSFKGALPEVALSLEASLLASLEGARVNELKFREALSEQEKKSFELDRMSIEYNVRKRELESDKAVYESVVERMKEVDLTKGSDQSKLKLHELPSAPGGQVWPRPSSILMSGFGGGLALALGLAYLLHLLDRSIKTVDQAEKTFHLPVLAAIPKAKITDTEAGAVLRHKASSPVAESFRSLRVMTNLLGKQEDRRTFLVTSAIPSEGKTFCSSNFAVSLAQQNLKTLLIDADLRKPKVSMTFFGEQRKPGLAELLLGQLAFADVLHHTEFENLTVLPAGSRSPNPAELLASPAFPQVIELALKYFDRIVIDTAPIVAVSDTLVIAPRVQTVLLVIEWNKTPSTVTKRALNLLRDAGKSPSGLIVNRLPSHTRGYYYYYSPGYYGSKGVYGAEA